MKKLKSIKEFQQIKENIKKGRDPSKPCVVVSNGTCGKASGADALIDAAGEEIKKLEDKVDLRITGCLGFCQVEPIVIIYPKGIFYPSPPPERVPEIIKKSILEDEIVDDLLYTDPVSGNKFAYEHEIPFYRKQERVILGNNSKIDPHNIDDYIAVGGYEALTKILSNGSPEWIIEEIKKSGLRGRGGVGFSTGLKWEFCKKAEGSPKYVICNAHEGDPGAYGNKALIESNPHLVIEGMMIGAYAVGAVKGYIYLDYEYRLAIERLKKAINSAREYGLLGRNILDSAFDFDIQVIEGGGAYICGEETSLIESAEGKPPEPRVRPPFPAELGIWEKPTVVNNVETWANVPIIIERGASWFSKIGTEKSKGTKVLSLVGNINNAGLIEVPMGTSLREVIFEIGRGIPNGKKLKAVQTGGPLGGFVPASLLDVPIDYEPLSKIGSPIGSGGIIVIDEDSSILELTKFLFNFIKDESCGKCTPCREGSIRMLEILTRISEGKGEDRDLTLLEELGETIKDASICGFGQGIPTPVLSSLRYFKEEYEAHFK